MSNNDIRKVCVVLVDRANYGRMKPVMQAVKDHPDLELQTIVSGTMVLERFDQPMQVVANDGFRIDAEVYVELEGSTPATMAKSVGFGIVEFTSELQRLKPDILLMIGDRYEALAATIAGAYMNLCIVHIQGGEVSGSIDESARHAMSKFSHFHFPSTRRSAEYLIRMGERPDAILGVGCPSGDIARKLDRTLPSAVINGHGSGAKIDVDQPFQLVVFHPTTTEFGGEREQISAVLESLNSVKKPTVLMWPNIDAGSDHVSKEIRKFRLEKQPNWLRLLINLPPEDYLRVIGNASCLIGNSSSFVRDASFFGTPVVLVGNRQKGREADVHVKRVKPVYEEIEPAVRAQWEHGRYERSKLYGDGYVAPRVADAIAELDPYVQKTLYYVDGD